MPLTGRWTHEAGYSFSSAVLCVTKILLDFPVGQCKLEFGVWENLQAYKLNSEPLYYGETSVPLHGGWPVLFYDDNRFDIYSIKEIEKKIATEFFPEEKFQIKENQ